MTGRADVIVISSSPLPLQAEPKTTYNVEGAFIIPPQPSSPSLSHSKGKAPSRSQYFLAKEGEESISKRKSSRTLTSDEPISKEALTKPPKKAQKAALKSTRDLDSLEAGPLDSQNNFTSKKIVKPRKPRSQKVATEILEAASPDPSEIVTEKKTAKPRKPRVSKKKEAKSELESGKISENPPKKSKKTAKKDQPEDLEQDDKQTSELGKNEDLHLLKSTTRRLDWTPPKDTASKGVINDLTDSESGSLGEFGKLISDYSFSGPSLDQNQISHNNDSTGPTKRRRIELVDHPVQPQLNNKIEKADSSASKTQLQQMPQLKRYSTLTARMTAMYSSAGIRDNDPSEDSQNTTESKPKRKTKSRKRELVSNVLAPEDVLKALDEQALVFGTCSQLQMNDSLEVLRETQQAIHLSESIASEEKERHNSSNVVRTYDSVYSRRESRTSGRNLWNVAARDTDGSLRRTDELEIVDLTETPPPIRRTVSTTTFIAPNDIDLLADVEKPACATEQDPAPIVMERILAAEPARLSEVSDKITAPTTNSQEVGSQSSSGHPYNGFTDAELLKQITTYGFKPVKGRKKMIELLAMCWESIEQSKKSNPTPTSQPQAENVQTESCAQEVAGARPKSTSTAKKGKNTQAKLQEPNWHKALKPPYAGYTDIELSRQVTAFGFKAVKSRKKMIALLETCWESIQQKNDQPVAASSINLQSCSTDKDVEVEIQDSEGSVIPPPSSIIPTKRKNASSKTSRRKKDAKIPSSISTAKSSKSGSSQNTDLPTILSQITKAVLPSSSGPGNPIWHEKILMYDAIFLEDLTKWLNVEGLGLVGEDREVSASTVREWCESKGICCCWRNSN